MGVIRQQPKHRNYFEAILQLRNPDNDIIGFVNRAFEGQDPGYVFISKRKKVTNGMDYYISSKEFAVSLGRFLYKEHGGELKITKKLFTQHRQTSKLLYRITVLYRMAAFRNGDYVLLNGRAFKITSLGRLVHAVDVETMQQKEFSYKEVIRGGSGLPIKKVIVSKVRPHLEIIHPETFQSMAVSPLVKDSTLSPGEKMRVAMSGDRAWRLV